MHAGERVGHFEILAAIGKGGMGEVWKARDARLNRYVALKTLPRELARDSDRLARLEREAMLLAAVSHPNIATIHGIEEHGDERFLVLELVEGATLEDRLARGKLELPQALQTSVLLARALEAAHERGVVHRDLKPANIKIAPDGQVKVLDFGLAKDLALSPTEAATQTAMRTEIGTVMGTPAYMSPEQARGEHAGRQTDIWSFGAVLFEMLTGKSPFLDRTMADTLARVLEGAPDYSALPASTPDGVRHVLRRCLEKDLKRRSQHIGDVRIELEEAIAARADRVDTTVDSGAARRPGTAGGRTPWARPAARRGLIAIGVSIVAVAAAIAAFLALRDDPAAPTRGAAASRVAPPATTSPDAMPNSVAVLPCENLSPNENDKYFAAGIHEEIVSELQKLSALTVINRRSVLRYSDTSTPIADIARELRVQTVMQCSVRYAGGSVRITATLIDPSTGVPRWSDQYPGQLDDIFAIQADVATKIAGALRAQLSPSDAQQLERRPTSSPEAYRLYLEALSTWQQAELNSGERIHVLVDRALELDDQFASAYGLKAAAYLSSLNNTVFGDAVAAAELPMIVRSVRDYANRALALDPFEPNARDALRQLNIATWNWTAYEQGLERRDEDHLRFQPLWALSWMGDHERAVRAGERGVLLNPNDAGAEYSLGVVYAYAGDLEAARQKYVRAAELSPDDALVRQLSAINAIARGDHDVALKELQLVEKLLGRNRPLGFLAGSAYCYSRIGRQADAERLYKEIEARGDSATVGVGTWAIASLAVGDTAGALRWLEAAAEKARKHEPDQGLLGLMNLRMNNLADPLLEQPQFADVLNRIRGS